MKKLIILSILLITSGYCFAQNDNILDVSVKFCNEDNITKSLSIQSVSGAKEEVCMQFDNLSDQDIYIGYEFVDGVTTADDYQMKACENTSLGSNFASLFSTGDRKLKLKAQSKLIKKEYLVVPDIFSGEINGCLAYFVLSENDKGDNTDMFNIVVRKATFIDVYPSSDTETSTVDVKDHNIKLKMKSFVSSKIVIYTVITLIIIILTIISLVKQRK